MMRFGVGLVGAALAVGLAVGASPAQELSSTCRFTSGPRAGEMQTYPGASPIPVGAPCHDGRGSFGVAVSNRGSPSPGLLPGPTNDATAWTRTCRFMSGPRAGQTQAYPGVTPIPIGTPCQDGLGSVGYGIADGSVVGRSGSENSLSNTCSFMAGPRTGQQQRYPGVPPIPVGSPCHDGMGSTGFAIPGR